jgi:hypothetical protein
VEIWRYKPRGRCDVSMTKRVNYRDGPEGCIVIAAVRKTASKFGKGSVSLYSTQVGEIGSANPS